MRKTLAILLGKAKSFFHLIGRRPIRGAERENRREFSDQSITGRTLSDQVKPDQILRRSSGMHKADEISVDRSRSSISREIPIPNFEVEASAEDYFFTNQGQQARGIFQEVGSVRWDHDEADWQIEDFDFQPSDDVAIPSLPPSSASMNGDFHKTKRPTQKELRSAKVQVRRIASERSWLSPKSSRALAKLGDKKAVLSRPETNALNYLLDRCAKVSELRDAVEILRHAGADQTMFLE
jgi:hypothetical protein